MNKKGFTLIELLTCLLLLGVVLSIGLYVTRDTLSTSLSTLTDVSTTQIYNTVETYVLENKTIWTNINSQEYTCVTVEELVDTGYFEEDEVITYKDNIIKIIREPSTKVINSVKMVDVCE